MTTAMGVSRYYDEDGHYVVDDPNTRTTSYQCGNGHRFTVDRYQGELTVNVLPE